jgi:hypothetical protein
MYLAVAGVVAMMLAIRLDHFYHKHYVLTKYLLAAAALGLWAAAIYYGPLGD